MRWAEPQKVAVRSDFDFPSTTTQRLRRAGGGSYWTVGLRVAQWIETNCVLTAAGFAGQPFKLLDWQKRLLAEMFEVVEDKAFDGGWRLKHRWVTLGVGKKNGKSELIGALALFFLLGTDEPDPRIFVAASTEDQANMVYAPVKYMAEQSPTISPLVQSKQRVIVSRAGKGGFIRRLAAVSGANDGANVYVALLDEFHEWKGQKGRDVWNVITNGTVMRDEPMIVQITTAGYDEDTLCYEWYETGKSQLAGAVTDETNYFCWFEADPDDDYKLEETWKKANPSYGHIMRREFYEDQLRRKTEAVFRRYFCNQWTESEEIWEAASKWDELVSRPGRRLEMSVDGRTYVGIDIGRKIDSSAVVACQLRDGLIHVHQKIWSNPYGRGDSRRYLWRMNIDDLDKFLRELRSVFTAASGWDEKRESRVAGPMFGYDPHLYGSHADRLTDDGLYMVEFPQTDAHMVPASQSLYEQIMGDRIVHDGDEEMRRHIRSVVAKTKERGWRISRPAGTDKHVDAAVAMAMAVRLLLLNEASDDEGSDEIHIW